MSTLDVEELIRRGQPRWARLGELIDLGERSGTALGVARLEELLALYRRSCSDLNLARRLTRNPRVLEPVNQIVGRAYRFIYSGRRSNAVPAGFLRRLLLQEIPETFQRETRPILMAALALLTGALVGAAATMTDPRPEATLVPRQFFTERPGERVAKIESGKERVDSLESATGFGASLYTHNIQVSFASFGLAALTLVGGIWLAFLNGIPLGALLVRYCADDVGTFFVAWIGPHGALELPSIIFATAAGLILGRALFMPGERGRRAAVGEALPSVWRMLLTVMLLLVGAGIIEGSFSQLSSKSASYAIKIGVAIALFSAMLYWLFLSATRERRAGPP